MQPAMFNHKEYINYIIPTHTCMRQHNFLHNPKTTLQKNNIQPEKQLGQNFLIDKQIIERVVLHPCLFNIQTVVEVGTGTGAITRRLAQQYNRVISVEKSKRLADVAKNELAEYKNVSVVCEDILQYTPPSSSYALVGAPPYYLTARLFRTFLQTHTNIPCVILVVIQKQVAQKIVQTPPHASLLSTAVHIYGTPSITATVPRNAFFPQPKIQSAILCVQNIQKPDINETLLFKIMNAGFSHPRKTLYNNFLQLGSGDYIEQWLRENNIQKTLRAQTLIPSQWVQLARSYCV